VLLDKLDVAIDQLDVRLIAVEQLVQPTECGGPGGLSHDGDQQAQELTDVDDGDVFRYLAKLHCFGNFVSAIGGEYVSTNQIRRSDCFSGLNQF
jgi:hypothetical protein